MTSLRNIPGGNLEIEVQNEQSTLDNPNTKKKKTS